MRGAFAVNGARARRRLLAAGHVAVVDDVMTTGSTVAELKCALLAAGVRQVDLWAVARAVRELPIRQRQRRRPRARVIVSVLTSTTSSADSHGVDRVVAISSSSTEYVASTMGSTPRPRSNSASRCRRDARHAAASAGAFRCAMAGKHQAHSRATKSVRDEGGSRASAVDSGLHFRIESAADHSRSADIPACRKSRGRRWRSGSSSPRTAPRYRHIRPA